MGKTTNHEHADTLRQLLREAEKAAAEEDWTASLAAFERALELRPANESGIYGKAYALRRLGDFQAADAVLEEGLQHHPHSLYLLSERGNLAYVSRRYAQAESSYEAALDLDPRQSWLGTCAGLQTWVRL